MVFAQSLKEYQWKNRLVFLVDESMESKTMNTQLQLFLNDSDELKERDIVLFQLTPKAVTLSNGKKNVLDPNYVYNFLSIHKTHKGVILVGKDGGIKLKKPFEVPPKDIYGLIDGMPMRKSEIKKKH